MDENIELAKYIHKDASMGVISITSLLKDINGKENKIKKLAEEQLKEYEKYLKESKNILEKNDCDVKESGVMSKMGVEMGVKKEVMKDNSDAALAHMLTEGFTMGIVNMQTKIKNYKSSVDSDILKLAKNFLKFQEDQIEELKQYM